MAGEIHGFLHISRVDAPVGVTRLKEVWAPRPPSATSHRLLKRLVAPQPLISPHLREAPRREPLKRWAEIEHDVLRTVLVRLSGESAEEKAAPLQRDGEMIDSLDRIGEMLEDVHRRDRIEGIGWKRRVFQINELPRQASSLHAPPAESEQR